jgi:hypothetical protein
MRLEMPDLFSQNRNFMGTAFSPTRQDVERYIRLRALGSELLQRIANTVPRHVFIEMAEALGVLRNGVPELATEHIDNVLADCCIFEWSENGKNLVQRYAETRPPAPGTDESFLLNAYLQAKYRVLGMQSAVADAGAYCDDVLTGEEMFLMDMALSRNPQLDKALIATRTISLGEYSMSCGAALPIDQKVVMHGLSAILAGGGASTRGAGSMAIPIVRACLAAGVADYVAHVNPEIKSVNPGATSKKPRIEPRFPGFKRRRRPAG